MIFSTRSYCTDQEYESIRVYVYIDLNMRIFVCMYVYIDLFQYHWQEKCWGESPSSPEFCSSWVLLWTMCIYPLRHLYCTWYCVVKILCKISQRRYFILKKTTRPQFHSWLKPVIKVLPYTQHLLLLFIFSAGTGAFDVISWMKVWWAWKLPQRMGAGFCLDWGAAWHKVWTQTQAEKVPGNKQKSFWLEESSWMQVICTDSKVVILINITQKIHFVTANPRIHYH